MNKKWTEKLMPVMSDFNTIKHLILAALVIQMTGCQTAPLQQDPHVEGKLENPSKATEVQEKINNVNARERTIKDLLAHAKMAWQTEDFERLNELYTELATFDPGNLRAKEGFLRIEMAKKHQALIAEAENLMGKSGVGQEMAIQKLHTVLLENAYHPKAKRLYNELLQAQENKRQEKLKHTLKYNDPVTML